MERAKKSSLVAILLLGFASKGYAMDNSKVNYATGTRRLFGDAQGLIILKLIPVSDSLPKAVEQIKRLTFQNEELTKKLMNQSFAFSL